jgi:hypothetical protein
MSDIPISNAPTSDTSTTSTSDTSSASTPLTTSVSRPPPTFAERVMEWSRPVIAVFSLSIFAFAFFVALKNPDGPTFSILVGAIVSLVASISGYYFGSSVGSQKKDDVIHNALVTAQASAQPPPPGP